MVKFTSLYISVSIALSAFGAPIPQPQLLKDLSPSVVALLSGLGLPTVGVPVGGVVTTLSEGLRKRQDTPDVGAGLLPTLLQILGLGDLAGGAVGGATGATDGAVRDTETELESRQLLKDLSPSVVALLSGLGLPTVGVPVGGVVTTASDDLRKRQGQLLGDLSPDVVALLTGLGLPTVGVPVGGIVTSLSEGLRRRQGQLLEGLSPDVVALLTGLGLPTIGVPVGAVVTTLSEGLRKRQDVPDAGAGLLPTLLKLLGLGDLSGAASGAVGSATDAASGAVGETETLAPEVESRQLLNDLSPSVVALLSGLGLPTVGVPVGGIVTTASDDLRKRQDAPDAGAGLLPTLLQILGLGDLAGAAGGITDVAGGATGAVGGLGVAGGATDAAGGLGDLAGGVADLA